MGKLLIIGGAEDKKGDCKILKKFVELSKQEETKIVIITTATTHPLKTGLNYQRIFNKMNIFDVHILDVSDRAGANSSKTMRLINDATGIFFTGGDQLRITSLIGGTRLESLVKQRFYQSNLTIAGTSAGASIMSSTMILEGKSDESPKIAAVQMSPGLGLLPGTVIDQHFAQRGRVGRLLSAIAHNPGIVGLGIDEDTAVIVDQKKRIQIVGNKTVTIIDGSNLTTTNIFSNSAEEPLALTNVLVHILPEGYCYDLVERKAGKAP